MILPLVLGIVAASHFPAEVSGARSAAAGLFVMPDDGVVSRMVALVWTSMMLHAGRAG